jgi:hypothetical protein
MENIFKINCRLSNEEQLKTENMINILLTTSSFDQFNPGDKIPSVDSIWG